MTTRIRKPNPVYAVVTARHEHGYGHIYIHVHEILGYNNGTLKISCQSGGVSSGETYAWDHGVSHHSALGLVALKKGYWLMRRITRELNKEYDAHGSPAGFSSYALRVLRAAGVRKVHVLRGLNSILPYDLAALPTLDIRKQDDDFLAELVNLEQSILGLS